MTQTTQPEEERISATRASSPKGGVRRTPLAGEEATWTRPGHLRLGAASLSRCGCHNVPGAPRIAVLTRWNTARHYPVTNLDRNCQPVR